MAQREVVIIRSDEIPGQPWWPALHASIIAAYKHKDIHVAKAFPTSWTRLDPNPERGAAGLVKELGLKGLMVIIFLNGVPVASSGLEPFRGEDWVIGAQKHESSAQVASGEVTMADPDQAIKKPDEVIEDWEICCFCVSVNHRREGLSRDLVDALIATIRPKGAKRLIANYSTEETGDYWPTKMGFSTPVGSGTVLRKGFTNVRGGEGLRADMHFRMGARLL